jgi:hypothetical protein
LRKTAEDMVKRVSKDMKGKKDYEPLKVGDKVRISTASLTEVKALGEITIRARMRKGQIYGFTKELYDVTSVKEQEDGTIYYKVNFTGSKKRNFLRHQLQLVIVEHLVPVGKYTSGDENFGQGTFGLEEHLKSLARHRAEANLTEKQFEKKARDEAEAVTAKVQVFDERDKIDTRRSARIAKNKKTMKVPDSFLEPIPEELKGYFDEEQVKQDKRSIGGRLTRSQAKKKDFSLAELQGAEQSQKRFDALKKKAKKKAVKKVVKKK